MGGEGADGEARGERAGCAVDGDRERVEEREQDRNEAMKRGEGGGREHEQDVNI